MLLLRGRDAKRPVGEGADGARVEMRKPAERSTGFRYSYLRG